MFLVLIRASFFSLRAKRGTPFPRRRKGVLRLTRPTAWKLEGRHPAHSLTHVKPCRVCSAVQKSGKTHCPMICFHVKRGHVRDNKWSVQINQADPRARRRRQQSRGLKTVGWLRFDDPSAHTAHTASPRVTFLIM